MAGQFRLVEILIDRITGAPHEALPDQTPRFGLMFMWAIRRWFPKVGQFMQIPLKEYLPVRLQPCSLLAAVTITHLGSVPTREVDLIYVSLSDNPIAKYDVSLDDGGAVAASLATFANTKLNNPAGLAFDSSGDLYMTQAGARFAEHTGHHLAWAL